MPSVYQSDASYSEISADRLGELRHLIDNETPAQRHKSLSDLMRRNLDAAKDKFERAKERTEHLATPLFQAQQQMNIAKAELETAQADAGRMQKMIRLEDPGFQPGGEGSAPVELE